MSEIIYTFIFHPTFTEIIKLIFYSCLKRRWFHHFHPFCVMKGSELCSFVSLCSKSRHERAICCVFDETIKKGFRKQKNTYTDDSIHLCALLILSICPKKPHCSVFLSNVGG